MNWTSLKWYTISNDRTVILKGKMSMLRFRFLNMFVGCVLFVIGVILVVSGFSNAITIWSIAIVCWIAGSVAVATSIKGKTHYTDSDRQLGPGKSSNSDSRAKTNNQPRQSPDYASWELRRWRWIPHTPFDIKHPYVPTPQWPQESSETETTPEGKNPYRL